MGNPEAHDREIHYTVDNEPQSTTSRTLTPKQILTNAGIDASTHYLVQIVGHERISYQIPRRSEQSPQWRAED